MNKSIKLDGPSYAMLEELAKKHFKSTDVFLGLLIETLYFDFKKTNRKFF